MRGLLILLWKEWRDARRLVVGACIASTTLSALAHWLVPDVTGAANAAEWLVPGLTALFAAAVASDLVAGDVSNGRMTTLALLPVPVRCVWRAKLVFLLTACAAFGVYAVAQETVLLAALGARGALSWFFDALPAALPGLGVAAALGAGTLFFSTIVERGIAAVLSALTVLGAGVALVASINPAYYGVPLTTLHVILMLSTAAAAFVVAARAAFVRGPIHSGAKPRLVAIGMVVLAAIVGPLGGGVAYAVSEKQAVSPGRATNWISRISVSPDGRFAALDVTFEGAERKSLRDRDDYAARVWIFDLDSGALTEVPERGTTLHPGPQPWTESGRLRVRTRRSTEVLRDGSVYADSPIVVREIDPRTGETLEEKRAFDVPQRPLRPQGHWAHVRVARTDKDWGATGDSELRYTVTWSAKSLHMEFAAVDAVPSPVPGVVLVRPEWGRLVRREFGSETTTELLRLSNRFQYSISFAPDGARALTTVEPGRVAAFDTRGGELPVAPWRSDSVQWATPGSNRYIVSYVCDRAGNVDTELIDLDGRCHIPLGRTDADDGAIVVCPLGDSGFVTATSASQRIVLRDRTGRVVRTLYPQENQ